MSTPQAKPKSLAENVAEFKVAQAADHQKKGEYAQAKQLLEEVLATLPQHADALHLMGILAQQTGRSSEALELLSQSVAIAPENPIFHQNLGNLQAQLGDLLAAARSYQRSLELDPQNMQCWVQLGDLLAAKAEYVHAEQCYANALKLDMNDEDNWMRLARSLRHQDRLDEAISVYLERLKRNPTNVRLLIDTGLALTKRGNLSQSAKALEEAARLDPSSAEAQYNLGVVYAEQGDFEAAKKAYQESLRLDPASTQPYPNLVAITRFKGGEALIGEMERRLKDGATDDINLHFALGKALDDAGDHDASFEHYLKGNAQAHTHLRYSTEAQWEFCRSVMQHFDRDTVSRLAKDGLDSKAPLFIVGMPRSGTSLVEQILASHPQVYGAGELTLLQRELMSTLGASNLKSLVGVDLGRFISMPAEQRRAVAAKTLSAMQRLAPDAARITDKMPQNFLLLGLLHAFFPAAKIVHCRRDPLDTCISCFTVLFGDGQEFAYDLSELGEYYGMYAALMKHWEKVLPAGSMMTVDYEEVVTDIRQSAERLLEHCGLPWDEACVSFHETKRAVQTASVYQVRQPLYRSSVGRWRRFESHLGPLREALKKTGVELAK